MDTIGLRRRAVSIAFFAAASMAAHAQPTLMLAMNQLAMSQEPAGVLGYYREPAMYGNTIVFTSEGDLWKVSTGGGIAQKLTSHPSRETSAAISSDGAWVAFNASYEGPNEVYVMPLTGGIPMRLTYEGGGATVVGWTPDGKVLYSTAKYSTLPNDQLCTVDPKTRETSLIPLYQAADGSYSDDGKKLFFTRFAFQGSQTKRYQGGTAQNIWRWDGGNVEAKPLTPDFKGTSRTPMWWNGRVYFESDRDGVMNIWSMTAEGKDLKQHTKYKDYDVQTPDLNDGRIVYQHGADLYLLDLKTGSDNKLSVRLASDFDQMRERWVKAPLEWTTAAHLSPDGTRVVLTARGQVFIAPVKTGRLIEATRKKSVRYRDARFAADGKSIVTFSDESGEVELWRLSTSGEISQAPEQLTKDGDILRLSSSISPDGKWIAHTDKKHKLYLYDVAAKANKMIVQSNVDDIDGITWSPDSKYLAFVQAATNTFTQIKLYNIATGQTTDVTTDRFNSSDPAFTPDGKFLFFFSDRNLRTLVGSPWGPRAPEPFFDNEDQLLFVSLQKGLRSPFQQDDELIAENKPAEKPDPSKAVIPAIETDGLSSRVGIVPVPSGNYRNLAACGNRLYFVSAPTPGNGAPSIVSVAIRNQNVKVDTIFTGANAFETTPDGRKFLTGVGTNIFVFDANGAPADPGESRVNLDGWTFSFDPREEWLQMFDEAWRLHRDYLYAPNMQGVDWPAMKRKYRPLVDRVTDRSELSDVLAQMVGEVSLLHTFVAGGDERGGPDGVNVGALGADWKKDSSAGGYRITRIYRTDPDLPREKSPLLAMGVELSEGDVITQIDGVPTLSVPDAGSLLRAKVGKQVRLRVLNGGDASKSRDVIFNPISPGQERNMRYSEWEYSRRKIVETDGKGDLGYVHLRAMGNTDFDQWARDFYPVFNRKGLIVDVRHNGGGNIDSWILEKLLRKAWMYWNQRTGQPNWNMQYAFRGHVVVLCDENTGSDGEAFSEGFRRLGLGKVIGTRTWGGEVWLTGSNTLVDNGVATAAEFGVYGPEGRWLIEGVGVEPDIVVDNLPYATFMGQDAQLAAAIKHLQDLIAKNPNPVTPVPPFPDRSFPPKKGGGGGG